MEPAVPSGETRPLTIVDDDEVVNLYDVPFVLINRLGDEVIGEVHLSGFDEIDHDRLMAAHSVAWENGGYRAYARHFAELYEEQNVLLLFFSDDPAKGTIWCLENNAWLQ